MTKPSSNNAWQQSLPYLIEMRQRLLRFCLALFIAFAITLSFANPLFTHLALPLLSSLSHQEHLIATSVAAPFIVPLKWAFMVALFATMPFFFHQVWGFIAPALYKNEKRLLIPILLSSSLLFYAGIAFSYTVVFPLIFNFFVNTTPAGVILMPDIDQYLSFTVKLFFAFGITFEVPVITVLLVWSGLTNVTALANLRPYIIVGAFILGMLLTPPDILSQILLAVPMWLLFELGLWIAKLYQPIKHQKDTPHNKKDS